jgi:hypothetical protein
MADMDHAIWRIKVIPFEVTIPDAEQDKRLSEKLPQGAARHAREDGRRLRPVAAPRARRTAEVKAAWWAAKRDM